MSGPQKVNHFGDPIQLNFSVTLIGNNSVLKSVDGNNLPGQERARTALLIDGMAWCLLYSQLTVTLSEAGGSLGAR